MKLSDNAVQLFQEGFNCSQAVFTSYAVTKGLDRDLALKISRGFGAGMGRLQKTCGAVTGAYMAISLSKEDLVTDEKVTKEETYSSVRKFESEFKKIYGTTTCSKLLGGCNLSTEEGQLHFKEKNLIDQTCTACVRDAGNILEKMLRQS